jgi:hypothetical protein
LEEEDELEELATVPPERPGKGSDGESGCATRVPILAEEDVLEEELAEEDVLEEELAESERRARCFVWYDREVRSEENQSMLRDAIARFGDSVGVLAFDVREDALEEVAKAPDRCHIITSRDQADDGTERGFDFIRECRQLGVTSRALVLATSHVQQPAGDWAGLLRNVDIRAPEGAVQAFIARELEAVAAPGG